MKFKRADINMLEAVKNQEQKTLEEAKKKQKQRENTGTHTTYPIKDLRVVKDMMLIAKAHDANMKRGGVSWYMLLLIGFNTGLRISDICRLRVRDVYDVERVRFMQRKNKKVSDFPLKEDVRAVLKSRLKNRDMDDFVICGRQARTRQQKKDYEEGVSRERAYEIICEIAKRAGYKELVGCHTMRKTYGYHFYINNGNDLTLLQDRFNHSHPSVTLHYIGLDRDARDKAADNVPSML